MNILIVSDTSSNAIYSQIEKDSIGYFSNIQMDDVDASIVISSNKDTYLLSLITNNNGINMIVFGKATSIIKNDKNYKITYLVEHVISDEEDVHLFQKTFPYDFKSTLGATLTKSEELIDITHFFIDKEENYCMIKSTDELIINSDPYRLLSYKTEVMKKEGELGMHSRLSHSIRVNHIANTIAGILEDRYNTSINYKLIQNICMASGMGHLPFGYVSEKIISDLLSGRENFIVNSNMLSLNYFKYPLQSARLLYLISSECSKNSDNLDLEVISGVLSQINFDSINKTYSSEIKLNEFFNSYFNCECNIVGKYLKYSNNKLISKDIEAQIISLSETIAQKTYDVQLSLRSNAVDSEEVKTRLRLISELTGESISDNFTFNKSKYFESIDISSYLSNYLIDSVSKSFKYELYKNRDNQIESYLDLGDYGSSILDVIDNYFQSKLLLLRSVRIYDHRAKNMILDIFKHIYTDINVLPKFYKKLILSEFKNNNIKDLGIVLCFISHSEGTNYIDNILLTDVSKIRDKKVQSDILLKRGIIVQVIVDYISMLSESEASDLYKKLVNVI